MRRSLQLQLMGPLSLAVAMLAWSPNPAQAGNTPASATVPAGAPRSEFRDDIGFGKDPFFPRSTRRPKVLIKTSPTEPVRPVVPENILLKGISFVKDRRLAIINNYTLGEGEEFTYKGGPQPVKIKCVEIKEKSVIISVGDATKELLLRSGF